MAKRYKASHHNLISIYLIKKGIRPATFVNFLQEFIRKKPAKYKSEIARLLHAQLKAQAELIIYNLNH